MTLFEELLAEVSGALEFLVDKPEEDAQSTVRALWLAAAGRACSAEQAAQAVLPDLAPEEVARLRTLVGRRLSGVPLSYLTHRQRFLGLEMYAASSALIPRKETEILGRAALELIHEAVGRHGRATVIDVCTGSGNLALAFACRVPAARVGAADLSEEAIAVARENARVMGLAERVDFRIGDLLEPFGGDWDSSVDVLTCNPPYISTGKLRSMPTEISQHEPDAAFDGGPFGIRILKRVVSEGLRVLRPGAWLCMEVGLGQGGPVAGLIERLGSYSTVRTFADQAGEVRALAAQVRS
jgi:release factor glutamine methyltransferase